MKLSILCVTRGERFALRFLREMGVLAEGLGAQFVLAADGDGAEGELRGAGYPCVRVDSAGYLESVLDHALGFCHGDYVLRLDDDERCSDAMVRWLAGEAYLEADNWKFARAHLWPTERSFVVDPPLWPDHQTRLAIRAKAGGRSEIHAGSPHGGGELAPVILEHWKFLVRPVTERRALVAARDAIAPGAGTSFAAFNVPEDFRGLDVRTYPSGGRA